ncbi:MAG: sensor histidine kinase [Propionicimonas sp.]
MLTSQIGVSVAMALTMVIVAAIAGPPLFEAHMHEAGHSSPEVLAHSEEAFSTAGLLALGKDGAIEPGPEAWGILAGQINRISRLADDLGQVSAAEEGRLNLDPRPTRALGLAEAAILAAREGFERKHVELQLQPYPGDGPLVLADPARVGQVLANLLSNALRHASDGGRVDLTVTSAGEWVEIQVRDDGEGIAAEHLPRIFERFYRVDAARDRQHGGTGVGLAISRAIARAHGGELSVTSRGQGAGAIFTLRLAKASLPE